MSFSWYNAFSKGTRCQRGLFPIDEDALFPRRYSVDYEACEADRALDHIEGSKVGRSRSKTQASVVTNFKHTRLDLLLEIVESTFDRLWWNCISSLINTMELFQECFDYHDRFDGNQNQLIHHAPLSYVKHHNHTFISPVFPLLRPDQIVRYDRSDRRLPRYPGLLLVISVRSSLALSCR